MSTVTKHPTMQPLKVSNSVHCSRENIELVLQETCVEYQSPLGSATVSPFELPRPSAGSGPTVPFPHAGPPASATPLRTTF